MSLKTIILAAALLSAVAASPVSAENYRDYAGDWRPPTLPRVTAVGASLNPWEARKIAVHSWRDKVASRFGFEYSRWFAARNKDVQCVKVADDDPVWDTYGKREFKAPRHYEPVTRCTVSANPARGWGGFYGWNQY